MNALQLTSRSPSPTSLPSPTTPLSPEKDLIGRFSSASRRVLFSATPSPKPSLRRDNTPYFSSLTHTLASLTAHLSDLNEIHPERIEEISECLMENLCAKTQTTAHFINELFSFSKECELKYFPGFILRPEMVSPGKEIFPFMQTHFKQLDKDHVAYIISSEDTSLGALFLNEEMIRIVDSKESLDITVASAAKKYLQTDLPFQIFSLIQKKNVEKKHIHILNTALQYDSSSAKEKDREKMCDTLEKLSLITCPQKNALIEGLISFKETLNPIIVKSCLMGLEKAIASHLPEERDFYLQSLESIHLNSIGNVAHRLFGFFYEACVEAIELEKGEQEKERAALAEFHKNTRILSKALQLVLPDDLKDQATKIISDLLYCHYSQLNPSIEALHIHKDKLGKEQSIKEALLLKVIDLRAQRKTVAEISKSSTIYQLTDSRFHGDFGRFAFKDQFASGTKLDFPLPFCRKTEAIQKLKLLF